MLIEAGASLNSLSADGSALMIASARKNNKIVRLFLEAGSNVDLVHKRQNRRHCILHAKN